MAKMSRLFLQAGTIALIVGALSACYHSAMNSHVTLVSRAHHDLLVSQNASTSSVAPENSTVSLSAKRAIELALANDADIKIGKASLLMAEAEVRASTQLENPELRYSQEKLEQGFGDDTRMDVEFRVEPPRPGELGARQAIAESDKRVAGARLSMTRNRVVSKVRSLFRELAFVKELLAATQSSIASSSQLVDLAKTRASQGLGTQVDVALASLAYEEVKQDATELNAELDILNETLLRKVGLPAHTELQLELNGFELDSLHQLAPETSLITSALANRFELEVATARMEQAAARSYLERSKTWPWLSQIRVGYEMRTGNEFEGAVTGGISIEIPLFNLNGGEIDKADARETLRAAQLEERVEFVVANVKKQYRLVQAAAEAVESLQNGSKRAALSATEAAKEAMSAGRIDIQGLTQLEVQANGIHRKWLKALRRYHQEVDELLEAVGAAG